MNNKIPQLDIDFLSEKYPDHEIHEGKNEIYVVLKSFNFPEMYKPRNADLLIVLRSGYPNVHPDMFWTTPDIKLVNDKFPRASEHHMQYIGKNWQRWSRHFPSNLWRPGIDDLRSYISSVKREIEKGI